MTETPPAGAQTPSPHGQNPPPQQPGYPAPGAPGQYPPPYATPHPSGYDVPSVPGYGVPPAPGYDVPPAPHYDAAYPPPAAVNPYQPGPGPYPYPPAPPTNLIAILSICLVFVNSIAGIVLGHIALAKIKRTGEQGRGLALAGLIVGYSLTGLGFLFVIAYVIFIFTMVGIASTTHSTY